MTKKTIEFDCEVSEDIAEFLRLAVSGMDRAEWINGPFANYEHALTLLRWAYEDADKAEPSKRYEKLVILTALCLKAMHDLGLHPPYEKSGNELMEEDL